MPHEPHGFSASMIVTGHEPALPSGLTSNASPSPAAEDVPGYIKTIQQRLQVTHQQMVTSPTTPAANPYQVGSLIFVLITPPERTSKLAPGFKGPYSVCRILNEYQVVYEDGGLERTIHINHAKPAKFTAPYLPEPVPPAEAPRLPLGYLPTGLARRPPKPRAPPVNLNESSTPPPAAPAEPIMPPPCPSHSASRTCSTSPAVSQTQSRTRSSSRILSCPAARQPHSPSSPLTTNSSKMARTYLLTIGYNESMGSKENPLSFTSLRLVDLRNGQSQYLGTMKQLVDALPKMLDPASRFVLRGHIAHPGQPRLRHSMRVAMWFLLPSDGVFRRSSTSLQYYLTCQGRRVVLRVGDVTQSPLERRLNWVPDPALTPPRDCGKENHPPSSQPPKLPCKMRPQRRKRGHHQQLPGANGNAPGIDLRPSERMSTLVKHPQHPQHPRPAANENSSRDNLTDQADHGRLYKQVPPSISKESTERSHREYFSGSTLSSSSKRSH